jgi:hypothetical protein
MSKVALVAGVVAISVGAGAVALGAPRPSGPLPQGGEPVTLDPAVFTTRIDNEYWPMRPGTQWIYVETDSEGSRQRDVVTVTHRTKKVANGITARVVRDVATEDGKLVEATDDYYAQDEQRNIWYLGEATTEYENGKPKSTEGSFEAGVNGAQPGVIMAAAPKPGLRYRQEYYKGHAEDAGVVISLDERVEVPYRYFPGRVLMTKDVNGLKAADVEFKFYARGVGPVLAITVAGGSDREELVRVRRGR